MNSLTVLWLALSAAFTALPLAAGPNDVGTRAQPACPADHELARQRIGNLLGSPLLPEMRARFDLGTASVDDVRMLSEPGDRDACVRLWEAMEANGTGLGPSDTATFFQSGNRYFVPVSRHSQLPPGVVRLDGPSSLDVYDNDFRLIGRFRA